MQKSGFIRILFEEFPFEVEGNIQIFLLTDVGGVSRKLLLIFK